MTKAEKSSKTQVVDSRSGARVPYLRGIMTRSLQSCGLNFKEAYKLAARIRRQLEGVDEITSEQLRQQVAKLLAEGGADATRRRYLQPQESLPQIQVVDRQDGSRTPFAHARLARSLETVSLSAEQASQAATRVLARLQGEQQSSVPSTMLSRYVYHDLLDHLGQELAHRYVVWLDFWHSGRPLILLIGGTNGVGKSTIATELAHRLDVVRTQSTDMLREVMRKMTPRRLLPAIHTSSFRAGEVLPAGYESATGDSTLAIDGFLTQAEQVGVAMDAVLSRALSERVSIILEGIHLHPSLMQGLVGDKEPIVVGFMLAVLDPDQLRQQLRGRATDAPNRRAERYLKNFDTIWQLQGYLLAEADRHHVPIVSEWPSVKAAEQAIDMIYTVLSRRFGRDESVLQDRVS